MPNEYGSLMDATTIRAVSADYLPVQKISPREYDDMYTSPQVICLKSLNFP